MKRMVVTGSSGLIGSEVVTYFSGLGWTVDGIDNNMRAHFFGSEGDTRWNQARLEAACRNFKHHNLDIRDRPRIRALLETVRPDVLVHAAAQPSHDLAARMPLEDFEVNALGTLALLETYRAACPDGIFVFMSTNKVYGDGPNALPMRELETRWECADPAYENGIPETFPVDQCMHSLFGASKLAADIYVQEYGRYYGLRTVCFRGGCLTGPDHSPVELHGFLAYMVRCNLGGVLYRIFGYKGKQVRDNIHAVDVVAAIHRFIESPSCGAVYNIGGGRGNSCSVLEALSMVEAITGRKSTYEYCEKNREGDHIYYVSDLSKIRRELRPWDATVSLPEIIGDIVAGFKAHRVGRAAGSAWQLIR